MDFALLFSGGEGGEAACTVSFVTVHDNVLTFTHPVYERFLDMKVIDGKKRKRVRIHNRFVYGTYSSLAERLMYGYTDDLNEAISSGKP